VPQVGDATPTRSEWQASKFSWHNKKVAWFLKSEGYRKRHQKEYDLDEIRRLQARFLGAQTHYNRQLQDRAP